MEYTGNLRKMRAEINGVVKYHLNLNGENVLELNPVIGKAFSLEWTGKINCISCGRSIRKTYGQGFCYECFTNAPEAAPCIMRPELCEAHLGKGRDVEWEETHHNRPHVVYLAQTSGIKVGVTRETQIPTRWIDQGAWRVIILASVPYRQMAGLIEVEMKQYLSDRTDWRKMLLNERDEDDLMAVRDSVIGFLPPDMIEFGIQDAKVYEFEFPVLEYPTKLEVAKLEDEPIRERLTGIRGQYLYFETGKVVNLRKYSGYEVKIEI